MPAYGEEDIANFRGRNEACRKVLEHLDNERAVVLHGPSGAGKSSLLWAGIVPERRSRTKPSTDGEYREVPRPFLLLRYTPSGDPIPELRAVLRAAPPSGPHDVDWNARVEAMLPDAEPSAPHETKRDGLSNLLAALARETRVLLVVDPLEQVLRHDELTDANQRPAKAAQRRRALGLLVHAALRAKECGYEAVFTLRSDLLDGPSGDPGFAALLARCAHPLGPMDAASLAQVIEGPFAGQTARTPPTKEFVARVIDDALAGSGNLALLASLLRGLWVGEQPFTLDAYDRFGGLGGSIQKLVSVALQGGATGSGAVSAPLDEATRLRVFRQLVSVSEEGRYLRRRVSFSDLSSRAGVEQGALRSLLDPFVTQRLVLLPATGGDEKSAFSVEVAHESLFTEWSSLKRSLDESRDDLRLRDAVEHAAQQRAKGGPLWPADEPRLPLAAQKLARHQIELSTTAERFLEESRARVTRDRRVRRAGVATIAMLAVVALVFAVRATRAQRLAEHQERIAVANRARAERLVNYMVFDLRNTLDRYVPQEVREQISSRVDQYYREVVRESALRDDASSQQEFVGYMRLGDDRVIAGRLTDALSAFRYGQAIALQEVQRSSRNTAWQRLLSTTRTRIGEVLVSQGRGVDALREFRESLTIMERLVDADPRNTEWQRDLSIVREKIGDVSVLQGDGAGALREFHESLTIRERLAQTDPRNTQWQRDLSISHNKIGNVLVSQGDGAGALREYRDDLVITEHLAQTDPRNNDWQRDLSISHEEIGDVLVSQGDVAGALREFHASFTIRGRLAQTDPRNTQWQRDLAISHDKLGDVLRAQGDIAGALRGYRESLTIRGRLAQTDPRNTQWRRDLSVSHTKIGDVLVSQGDSAGALREYREDLSIVERLTQTDPRNTEWQRDLSIIHDRIGDMLRAQGDIVGALREYRESLTIRARLLQAHPRNTEWQRDLSISHEKNGSILVAQGDQAGALREYRESLRISERLALTDPNNAVWQSDLASSLLLTGRATAARGDTEAARALFVRGRDLLRPLAASHRLTATAQRWLIELEAFSDGRSLARSTRDINITFTHVTGLADVSFGASCRFRVNHSPTSTPPCQAAFLCGGHTFYGGGAFGWLACTWTPTALHAADNATDDGDGAFAIDTDTHTVSAHDIARNGQPAFSVEARITRITPEGRAAP